MKAGVKAKNIFAILSDGLDNGSSYNHATDVKKMITHMMKDEHSAGNFGVILCGIGERQGFENAKNEMGIPKLFVIDPTKTEKEVVKEFRNFIGILSQSISSASTAPGTQIVF